MGLLFQGMVPGHFLPVHPCPWKAPRMGRFLGSWGRWKEGGGGGPLGGKFCISESMDRRALGSLGGLVKF